MKKNTLRLSVLSMLLSAQIVTAQQEKQEEVELLDEVVLSDTKFELKKENSGKIIYKITKKQIEQSTGKTVSDLIDQIAGVEISGNNNARGGPIGIYIRGGRNRQVAIVIDGILVSDPTGISSSYNLNLLNLNEIESIEILKGSSSTLYGSGAATGVINIKLKKPSKAPIAFNYTTSIGTNNTQRNQNSKINEVFQSAGLRGTLNKFNYLSNFSFSKTNGMSSASDIKADQSFGEDSFSRNDLLIKLGYAATENLSFEFFGNYNEYQYDYDAGAYFDSDINNGFEKQYRYGLKSNYNYKKGELIVTISVSDLDRGFDSYNSWVDETETFLYKGTSVFAEAINKFEFSEKSHLIFGLNYQEFENQTNSPYGNIDKELANYWTLDPFVSYVYTHPKGFNLNIGSRLNNHSEYGNHFIYNINPSYTFIKSEELNFKGITSYSTAFIAPSTYQLFSQYGNFDLKPEENATFELGFEANYKKWLNLTSVFFHREEDNTIIFVTDPVTYEGGYQNSEYSVDANGIETTLNIEASKVLKFLFMYTYTEKSEDFSYIPKNKFSASIMVNPMNRMNLSVDFKAVGDRTYFDEWGSFGDPGENVILESYSLVDLNANYTFENVSFFVHFSNIFNEDYEDVIGYSTRGRNYRVGMRFRF